MRQNNYSCEAFQGSNRTNSMRYVHSITSYVKWLKDKGISWSVINVYNRRTSEFIRRYYKGDYIHSFPRL